MRILVCYIFGLPNMNSLFIHQGVIQLLTWTKFYPIHSLVNTTNLQKSFSKYIVPIYRIINMIYAENVAKSKALDKSAKIMLMRKP